MENVFSIEKLCIYLSCNLYRARGGRHQASSIEKLVFVGVVIVVLQLAYEIEEMFILQKLKLNIVYQGKRYLRTEYTHIQISVRITHGKLKYIPRARSVAREIIAQGVETNFPREFNEILSKPIGV